MDGCCDHHYLFLVMSWLSCLDLITGFTGNDVGDVICGATLNHRLLVVKLAESLFGFGISSVGLSRVLLMLLSEID